MSKYSIPTIQNDLQLQKYIADTELATFIYLGLTLEKPMFLEGEAGVGKSQLALSLAKALDIPLIRLQCYEGLEADQAIYSWNYAKQIIDLKLAEIGKKEDIADKIFSKEYLLPRPLIQAISSSTKVVLLIDEIDRADPPFEAFLLEFLSDFTVSIPELGTIKAKTKPIVIITSNRTREVNQALLRRAYYKWIGYPTYQQEIMILSTQLPKASKSLIEQVAKITQQLRNMNLLKNPGVSESLDWLNALLLLEQKKITQTGLDISLSSLLKTKEDLDRFKDPKNSIELLKVI